MRRYVLLSAAAVSLTAGASTPPAPAPWGAKGHTMAARAAAENLPPEMPAFFRDAGAQLAYLNPEPDRWRERALPEMDQAWSYDHYVDLENVPRPTMDAPDRFTYLRMLYQAGLERPERDAGFLHFRIVELYQRLVTEWRLWRAARTDGERSWIEARILNDAGLLGHYVTDAAQPHHTTIHFNGWASQAPNPEGFTYDRSFHGRFESDFVNAHVVQSDVSSRVGGAPRSVAGDARAAVLEHIMESHALVEELYRLDRDHGFDPGAPPVPQLEAFTVDRLAAGAEMLRTLWWSAWLESGQAVEGDGR